MTIGYLLYHDRTGQVLGTINLPVNVMPDAIGCRHVMTSEIKNFSACKDIFRMRLNTIKWTLEPLKTGFFSRLFGGKT